MTIRTQLRAGSDGKGHNLNHSEALQVRTALKAGGINTTNHNEALRREPDRQAISMKKQVRATGRKQERLELLVVRAGLRAGRAVREGSRRHF